MSLIVVAVHVVLLLVLIVVVAAAAAVMLTVGRGRSGFFDFFFAPTSKAPY